MKAHLLTLLIVLALPAAARGAGDKHVRFGDPQRAFRQALELLSTDYLEALPDEDLYRAAVAGMLTASGRQWDQLMSPEELQALKADLTGEVVGVGMQLKFEATTGMMVVEAVVEDSPAQRAGIAAGDQLLQVDSKPLRSKDPHDVARLIRGPAGTPVTLALLHDAQVVTMTLQREKLVLGPVGEMMLPDGLFLIALRNFNERTPALLHAALEHASAQRPRGLILDLRNNQGGLLDSMITCAGYLMPPGSVVAQLERRGGAIEQLNATVLPVLRGVPVVVLINGNSASSAEILAGALRDSAGARTVGAKTFGKWNVQRIEQLTNGWAIKLTIGRFHTPRGESLDGKGLEPDLPVEFDGSERAQRMTDAARRLATDPQLRAAASLLRLSR